MNTKVTRPDLDAFTVEPGDGRQLYLGSWSRHPRDGAFAALWQLATNARGQVSQFFIRRANVLGDQRLSDQAKKDDEKTIAKDVLQALGALQRGLNHEVASHHARRLKLAEVAPADAAQTLIDLALAEHYRRATASEREQLNAAMAGGEEPRTIAAVLRLPRVLFGMTPEVRDVIHSGAIARANPDAVRELQQLSDAARMAQFVLSRAVQTIIESSALTLEERMVTLGADAWQQHVRDGSPAALQALAGKFGVKAAGDHQA